MKKIKEQQKSTADVKPILAVETTGAQCGVCVYFTPEKYAVFSLIEERGHAKKIKQLISDALDSFGLTPSKLKKVIISGGPGSFTGLRIGFSVAKGIALGQNLPLFKINTLDAIAYEMLSVLKEGDFCNIFMKINKKEVYFRRFQKIENFYKFVTGLEIIENEAAAGLVTPGDFVTGNFEIKHERFVLKNFPSPLTLALLSDNKSAGMVEDDDFLEPDYIKEFTIVRK